MKRQVAVLAVLAPLLTTTAIVEAQVFDADPNRDALEGIQLRGRGTDTEYTGLINILIERGRVAPAQNLLRLDSVRKIELRLEGPAQFYYHSSENGEVYVRELTYRGDRVSIPQLMPGEEESFLHVQIQREGPWDPISVAVADEGHIHRFLEVEFFRQMILRVDERNGYVILDAARLDVDQMQRDAEKLLQGEPGEGVHPCEFSPLGALQRLVRRRSLYSAPQLTETRKLRLR